MIALEEAQMEWLHDVHWLGVHRLGVHRQISANRDRSRPRSRRQSWRRSDRYIESGKQASLAASRCVGIWASVAHGRAARKVRKLRQSDEAGLSSAKELHLSEACRSLSVHSPFHATNTNMAQAPSASSPAHTPSLANFGIVLTGRLKLRNELLSTFSMPHKDVWEEYARFSRQ